MEHDAGPESMLAEGEMREVELVGCKLLLARTAGLYQAVDAACPHAGGPLAQGVLHNGTVICPWHKAAFRVDDGAHLEPPAVDDLRSYPVRIADGRISVTLTPRPAKPLPRADAGPCMAIIGAGAAGAVAAQTLREQGFTGRIVMVGREDRLPYDRTLLSKYKLSGKQGGEKSPLQDEIFYTSHRIERRTGEAVSVDARTRLVRFADASTMAFDAALVATGGRPRPLSIPGAGRPGVFLLRTPDDADAILARADRASRAVVIGAGFIGMEVAASLRERGLAVTVAAPQSAPFEAQLGAEIGNAFRRLHERQGVTFRLGQPVAAIDGGSSDSPVSAVRLRDGSTIPADLVVAGVGIAPITDLLMDAPRQDDGGVTVDANLRVTGSVFAAGDIAAFPLQGDGPPTRVEHWRVAEQHGRVAALNMLGRNVAYDAVPYFWTIQYLKRLDYVGHAETWDDIVIDGDLDKPEFIAFYIRAGSVAAVAGWDRDKQMAQVVHLMTERRQWPLDALRDALGVG